MEIAPDIHLIPGTVGARPLQLILLRGDAHIVLLDTGTKNDPERFIQPYLKSIGLALTNIDLVINTHADADHVGGNAALKRVSPRAAFTCGQADRTWIEQHGRMLSERYGAYRAAHDIGPDADTQRWFVEMLGAEVRMDWTWVGGETLSPSKDWTLEIHHTPGHSPGHLTLFDRRSRTALMGDAVHGGIGRDNAGNLTFPAYADVPTYLASVAAMRELGAETLTGCHWELLRGAEIGAFLDASEAYVRMLDAALLEELSKRPDGATLRELIQSIGARWLGDRPVWELELVYTFAANMDSLVAQGQVNPDASAHPIRYHRV